MCCNLVEATGEDGANGLCDIGDTCSNCVIAPDSVIVLPFGVITVGVIGVRDPPPVVQILGLLRIVAPGTSKEDDVGGWWGGDCTLSDGVMWLGLQVSSTLSWIQAREAASSLLHASSPFTTSCCSCKGKTTFG